MKGYWNQPERTAEVLGDDGWLRTGDVARMDENGYVQVTGRIKDMVIRGGENIYPREIEEFLYTHPDIIDARLSAYRMNATVKNSWPGSGYAKAHQNLLPKHCVSSP